MKLKDLFNLNVEIESEEKETETEVTETEEKETESEVTETESEEPLYLKREEFYDILKKELSEFTSDFMKEFQSANRGKDISKETEERPDIETLLKTFYE